MQFNFQLMLLHTVNTYRQILKNSYCLFGVQFIYVPFLEWGRKEILQASWLHARNINLLKIFNVMLFRKFYPMKVLIAI